MPSTMQKIDFATIYVSTTKSTKGIAKMSKPKGLTANVSLTLSQSDRDTLEQLARETALGRSGVLREAFQLYVANRQRIAA